MRNAKDGAVVRALMTPPYTNTNTIQTPLVDNTTLETAQQLVNRVGKIFNTSEQDNKADISHNNELSDAQRRRRQRMSRRQHNNNTDVRTREVVTFCADNDEADPLPPITALPEHIINGEPVMIVSDDTKADNA